MSSRLFARGPLVFGCTHRALHPELKREAIRTRLRQRMRLGNRLPTQNLEARAMTEPKERTYSDDEIKARLSRDLPHWYLENGWIRRKYKTHGWKGTLMVINTVGHLAERSEERRVGKERERRWG